MVACRVSEEERSLENAHEPLLETVDSLQLYSDSDCSYGDIERVLRHEGKIVPKKTIWAIIKKYKEHGTIGRLAGSGRQPKLTAEVLALVEAKMRRRRNHCRSPGRDR